MIFKTWLSDINKTALALESLNKIKFNVNALSVADISRIADVKNITTVFNELQSISKADYGDFGALKIQESAVAVSTLSGELQASTLMMNGFSEAETRAVLSANGLTDAEIEQALAFAQSGESIKLYNAEVIKAGLQNSALSSTEQKLVLDKLGLIDATTGELISTKQVTQAKLEEALINSGLEASEASVTAERIVSTVAQGTQKASIEAILALTKKQIVENTKYIASMVAAHPIATALGVALAALGGAILYNTHKEKEYQKALKESVDAMSSATSEYSNSASKLDELTEKYKSLEKQLSLTNLTEEETYQIKSDLYDVQCDLIDNFGNEAKGIDLVNGEYREQLGLLQQINKEAAEAYLTKNKEDYDNNISYLTDKEDFRSKYTSEWSSKNSGYMSDDLKNILEANGLTIDAETWRSELGGAFTKYFVEFENVTREEAYNLAMQLGEVLRSAGEENADLMEDPYYDLVQSYLSYVTTELIDESELNSAKENADYYEKLSAMYSSSFGNLYNSFVDARDEYLEALQTGENVDNARINFDNIYGEFQNSSKVKSDEIKNAFADVKNSIDDELVKLNDWEKSLSGSNELDVISSLKVTDDQLRGINWDDEFTSPAEEAFGNLLTYLGASREDIEQVISLLVKMGAVMGEVDVKGDTFNDKYPISSLSISDTISQLNTQLKPAFDSLKSAFQSIFTSDGYNSNAVDIPMLESIKSSIEEINELEDVDITIDMDAFDSLATTLADINTTEEQAKQAFNDFATSIFYATNATDGMTEETKELVEQLLESLGIVNATEVAEYALAEAKAKDMLATYDLINAKESEYVAILAEGEAAGIARQQLYKLMAAEIAFGNNDLNTEQKIEQLRNLAKAYGDTASAALATAIANDLASGHTDVDSAINDLMAQVNSGIQKVDIDFSPIEKSAAKAGSSAGKSYADALKDELSNLNSVINYIGDTIDDQIDLFEEQKDAAVDALEAEKEAAEEALEAEKELIQGKIDAKQAEIDAIEDAAIARKNELDLQQKQYELERMQNQKTMLVNYMPDTIVI